MALGLSVASSIFSGRLVLRAFPHRMVRMIQHVLRILPFGIAAWLALEMPRASADLHQMPASLPQQILSETVTTAIFPPRRFHRGGFRDRVGRLTAARCRADAWKKEP